MINLIRKNFEEKQAEWRKVGNKVDRAMRGALRRYAEEVAGQVQEDIGRGGFDKPRIGHRTWQINNRPKPDAGSVYRRTGELAGSINAAADKKGSEWIGRVGTPKKVGLYIWKGTRDGPGHGKAIPLQVITGQPEKDEKGRDKWVRIKRRKGIRARPYFEDAAKKKEARGSKLIDRAIRKALAEVNDAT